MNLFLFTGFILRFHKLHVFYHFRLTLHHVTVEPWSLLISFIQSPPFLGSNPNYGFSLSYFQPIKPSVC